VLVSQLSVDFSQLVWPPDILGVVVLVDSDPYVMVPRFVDLQEALVAKSALESSGIESYVADENTIHLIGSHLAGVRLFVRKSNAEAASTLLEKAGPQNS
jgi:hypothetical protein